MLNDENNEGKTTDNDEEEATSGRSDHPASSTSKHGWCSVVSYAKRWICASKNIDWLSRRIFPSTFIIFNLVYWSIYLSPPHFHCDVSQGIEEPCFTTHDIVF